jgi:hypothetical protein
MFSEHATTIAKYAAESPENLFDVMRFVVATINRTFYTVPQVMAALRKTGTSKALTGVQKRAIAEYWTRRQEIFDNVYDVPIEQALLYLVTLPGLGIPKAGFVLQLARGRVGCLDTWNLRRFGLDAKQFNHNCSATRLLERIRSYILICEDYGTARLWDEWCELIALRYPTKFTDAEQVSRLHQELIVS